VIIKFYNCSLYSSLGPTDCQTQCRRHAEAIDADSEAYIVVVLYAEDGDIDPLLGIPSEFEVMRTKNIIETITIEILLHTDASYSRGDDWGRLDEVLTTPGWFSLKQVSLVIEIDGFSTRDDELALRNLPETQFPRLSSCNSILFHFEVSL
jgi:hypothetical protein